MTSPGNASLADKLREMADLLEVQHEDGYRIAAYRRAARTLLELEKPVEEIVRDDGLKGVVALPGIGRGIGTAIIEIVTTGRWNQLDRLLGKLEPEQLFQTVPGIGPQLAARIHDELHTDTLEQLEQAAHDGRLEKVPGVGARRALAIKGALADRLAHRRYRQPPHSSGPPVTMLLDVDREYRTKAAQDKLRKIAPKRFNPSGEAWLPVLHTSRDAWQFTVLFSNTQRAHELQKTNDWVVVYFHTDSEPEAQCTIVTETRGPLEGKRVVRGREGDCIDHYSETDEQHGAANETPTSQKQQIEPKRQQQKDEHR
jgi:putative hydrolase